VGGERAEILEEVRGLRQDGSSQRNMDFAERLLAKQNERGIAPPGGK
jgi:hypothetical protein